MYLGLSTRVQCLPSIHRGTESFRQPHDMQVRSYRGPLVTLTSVWDGESEWRRVERREAVNKNTAGDTGSSVNNSFYSHSVLFRHRPLTHTILVTHTRTLPSICITLSRHSGVCCAGQVVTTAQLLSWRRRHISLCAPLYFYLSGLSGGSVPTMWQQRVFHTNRRPYVFSGPAADRRQLEQSEHLRQSSVIC